MTDPNERPSPSTGLDDFVFDESTLDLFLVDQAQLEVSQDATDDEEKNGISSATHGETSDTDMPDRSTQAETSDTDMPGRVPIYDSLSDTSSSNSSPRANSEDDVSCKKLSAVKDSEPPLRHPLSLDGNSGKGAPPFFPSDVSSLGDRATLPSASDDAKRAANPDPDAGRKRLPNGDLEVTEFDGIINSLFRSKNKTTTGTRVYRHNIKGPRKHPKIPEEEVEQEVARIRFLFRQEMRQLQPMVQANSNKVEPTLMVEEKKNIDPEGYQDSKRYYCTKTGKVCRKASDYIIAKTWSEPPHRALRSIEEEITELEQDLETLRFANASDETFGPRADVVQNLFNVFKPDPFINDPGAALPIAQDRHKLIIAMFEKALEKLKPKNAKKPKKRNRDSPAGTGGSKQQQNAKKKYGGDHRGNHDNRSETHFEGSGTNDGPQGSQLSGQTEWVASDSESQKSTDWSESNCDSSVDSDGSNDDDDDDGDTGAVLDSHQSSRSNASSLDPASATASSSVEPVAVAMEEVAIEDTSCKALDRLRFLALNDHDELNRTSSMGTLEALVGDGMTADVESMDKSRSDEISISKVTETIRPETGDSSPRYNPANCPVVLKVLVSDNVARSIIGRAGQTISELQSQSSTRIKLSQAGDYYPGTQDRVCLVRGDPDNVKTALRMLLERLYMLQEHQHSQHMAWQLQRQKGAMAPTFDFVVRLLVPSSSCGMIIGKSGSNIKFMEEKTGVLSVRLSPNDQSVAIISATSERVVTITGPNLESCLQCLYHILDGMTTHPDISRYTNMTTSYSRVMSEAAGYGPAAASRPVLHPIPSASPRQLTPGQAEPWDKPIFTSAYAPVGPTGTTAGRLTSSLYLSGKMMLQRLLDSPTPEGLSGFSPGLSYDPFLEQLATPLFLTKQPGQQSMDHTAPTEATGFPHSASAPDLLAAQVLDFPTPEGLSGFSPGLSYDPFLEPPATPLFLTKQPGQQSMDHTAPTEATGFPHSASAPDLLAAQVEQSMRLSPTQQPSPSSQLPPPLQQSHPSSAAPHYALCASAPDLLAAQVEQSMRLSPTQQPSPSSQLPPPLQQSHPSSAAPHYALVSQTPTMTAPGCFQAQVLVPDSMIGSILGRAGRTLTELQMLSGTRIRISQRGEYMPGTRSRIVTIRGPTCQCVWQAQYMMNQRMVLPPTAYPPPTEASSSSSHQDGPQQHHQTVAPP